MDMRRKFGEHMTPLDIFNDFIYPSIEGALYDYIWVDMYAGEGNLILPILEHIPAEERDAFFEGHIRLFDIQKSMTQRCLERVLEYGISEGLARKRIVLWDSLEAFPESLTSEDKPIYHITNPPYLYIGHIKKDPQLRSHLAYFRGKKKKYQDVYQVAMANDLDADIRRSIYLIPSNFVFGDSVSNQIRRDFFRHYVVSRMYIFENKIFEFTGTNACLCFFERKERPSSGSITFLGTKIKKDGRAVEKRYTLSPKFNYRAGEIFDEFVSRNRAQEALRVSFHLTREEVEKNRGSFELAVIDANNYGPGGYEETRICVNEELRDRIKSNILYIRTIDTGGPGGRIGLGVISDDFRVSGIYVSEKTYRTHPIQLFLSPRLSEDDQWLLCDYFNLTIESLRKTADSDFLTTYRYSSGIYARKYMGLAQARALIRTFPILSMDISAKEELRKLILSGDIDGMRDLVSKYSERKILITDYL